MTEPLKVGDLVYVKSKDRQPIVGIVSKELKFYSGRFHGGAITPMARRKIEENPEPRILEIRFNDWMSDEFFEEECRKLTKKEIFKAKLTGDFDYLLKQ